MNASLEPATLGVATSPKEAYATMEGVFLGGVMLSDMVPAREWLVGTPPNPLYDAGWGDDAPREL